MEAKRVCCRCQVVLSEGHAGDAHVTHTICLDCLPSVYPYVIERVSDCDREALDALPFGLVRLDAVNRVTAYNTAEARLSHRAPADVIGRDFFTEIAPCTNVRELAGWLEAARQAGRSESHRLKFIFDFPHGRQFVDLAISHDADSGAAILVVDLTEQQLRST